MAIRATTWASLLYLIPALGGLGSWFLIVGLGNDSIASIKETALYMLNEEPTRVFFRWMLALPIIGLALSVAYMSEIGRRKTGLVALLGVGVLHALAAWSQLKTSYAVSSVIALLFGILALKAFLESRAVPSTESTSSD